MDLILDRIKKMFPRSLLGEFLEIFGKQNTIKLIDVFSGTTLEIPSRRKLEILDRDIQIYEELSSCTSRGQQKTLRKSLAKKHSLSETQIRDVFKKMEKQLRENRKFKLADERTEKLLGSQLRVSHKRSRH